MIMVFLMMTLRRFMTDTAGALSILFVILVPLLMVIGGAATDVSLLNSQKRYTQSQADLAALSAARYLPDPVATRQAARDVVLRNDKFGEITLSDGDIRIGRYDPETEIFIPAPNQTRPEFASAVQVIVPSRFRPILLSPVLSDENITLRRAAIGTQRGIIVFSLRNRLLSLNTDHAILGRVLGPLGLGLNTEVLGYMGLATTRIRLDNLLALIVGTELGLDALSFNDVLNLQVGRLQLLQHLVTLGGLADIDINPTAVGIGPLTLGQIVGASLGLLGLTAGDILPDIELNVFDIVMAMAGLAAVPNERISVGLPVSLPPLAEVSVSLGLIRPAVMATGYVGDTPPPRAEVAQVDARVNANVLDLGGTDLLSVRLSVSAASASAEPVSLNCAASEPTDVLAVFTASTAPAELALRVGLLDSNAQVEPKDMEKISIGGRTQQISVRLNQLGQPVPVHNPILLSSLLTDTNNFLQDVKQGLQNKVNRCSGLLGTLLCPLIWLIDITVSALIDLLTAIIKSLANFLAALGVNEFLQAILRLLGIELAQADLVLTSYSCGATLVR